MYTLKELQDKTFKELKAIGWQLNALPDGDKRCRQNWVDAIAGVLPPLLELLESAPADFEHSPGAIEVQHQKPIAQLPKTASSVKDIQGQNNAEPSGTGIGQTGTDEIEIGAVIHQQCLNTAQPDGDISSLEAETLGYQTCDRVLARARDGQAVERRPLPCESNELAKTPIAAFNDEQPPNRGDNGRDRLESQPTLSQSAITPAIKNHLDRKSDLNPILTGITFSHRFLALYSPPQSQNIRFKSDTNGQLSLLDFEIESTDEPPDPDDFDGNMFAFWAAYDAWHEAHPDEPSSEHCEPIELSLSSMRIDAQAGEMPDTNEIIETSSITLEMSAVADFVVPIKSSDTCKFLIPVFGVSGDRITGNDEPPTPGVGARLPLPKPPQFPPVMVAAGDRRSSIKKFARSAILLSGRAPPGGDAY